MAISVDSITRAIRSSSLLLLLLFILHSVQQQLGTTLGNEWNESNGQNCCAKYFHFFLLHSLISPTDSYSLLLTFTASISSVVATLCVLMWTYTCLFKLRFFIFLLCALLFFLSGLFHISRESNSFFFLSPAYSNAKKTPLSAAFLCVWNGRFSLIRFLYISPLNFLQLLAFFHFVCFLLLVYMI